MRRIKEVIVVEGRYDKNTLSQTVDATILETRGFGIFSDEEKLKLLRRLAEQRGIILMMDSDGAGFLIRNYLKGALPPGKVRQAYIPDRYGKERRKRQKGKEGKLGVEGMTPAVLLEALRRAGATFLDDEPRPSSSPKITKADLYDRGLSGQADSAVRRKALLQRLDLPEHLNANALLDVLNLLYTREEFEAL